MNEKSEFYDVRNYGDRLEPGDRIKIEHYLYYRNDGARLSSLTHLPADKLAALREESAAHEKSIYEKLVGAVKEWEEQGAHTMLLDKAIEYIETPPVKHTANEWVAGDNGFFECSNMVYKMIYHISEDTKYNTATKTSDTVAWVASWDVRYNFPEHARGGGHIAGQEKKKFTSKEKMDNYIIGRIAAHAQYFTELSPPVPKDLAWKFSRNGQLMPGYTVEGQEPPAPGIAQAGEPAPVKAETPEKPASVKDTPGTDYSKFIRKKPQKDGERKKAVSAR